MYNKARWKYLLVGYLLLWNKLSAENGFGLACGMAVGTAMGLALETGGGRGAANMGAFGNDECIGGVGLGGAGLNWVGGAGATGCDADIDTGTDWALLVQGLLRLLVARLEDTVVEGGGQLLSVVVTLVLLKLLTLLKNKHNFIAEDLIDNKKVLCCKESSSSMF